MTRLDQALVERGMCETREKAKRSILAGLVRLNGQRADKAGHKVRPADLVELERPEKFVSRGGHKLEHALLEFSIPVAGARAIDIGASTGGFTDCLLQHGAASVCAVDVGHGQLAWKLRQDPRVTVMEKMNARHLTPAQLPSPFIAFDLGVIDCSFISLEKILPPIVALIRPGGTIVALVKPQFEAGKAEVDKGEGVITDPTIHDRILKQLEMFTNALPGLKWKGLTASPLLGPAGNKEFLAIIEKET